MEKIKIYEIANNLNMSSKEVIEALKAQGIEAKSHLSSITKDQEETLLKSLKKDTKKEKNEKGKEVASEKMSKKEDKKDVEKEDVVIISRVVKGNTSKVDSKKETTEDLGKVVEKENKSKYIAYRHEVKKPKGISELFGLNNKKEEKKVVKEAKKEVAKEEVKTTTAKETPKAKTTTETDKKNTSFKGQANASTNSANAVANTSNKFANGSRNSKNDRFEKNASAKTDKKQGFKNNQFAKNTKPQTPFQKAPQIEIVEPKHPQNRHDSIKKDKEKYNQKETSSKEEIKKTKKSGQNKYKDNLNSFKNEKDLSKMIETGDVYDIIPENRFKKDKKKKQKEASKPKEQAKLTEITIKDPISVKDLAQELKITVTDILKTLMNFGVITNINGELDFDTAYLIASEYGIKANKKKVVSYEEELFDESEDNQSQLISRPPVVVVMGHVDHGKTSLLDAIRNTNKIEQEAGGITQHIGAYQVEAQGRQITFLDTPGHEAFTSMRARGAKATDIAILVVAANDGVMPQTIEAINHAKAAEIPIVVAINKMDLDGANPEKVKQELAEHGLIPEEWGGDTIFVPISAKQNTGIDKLLEMVLLQADMLELKVNPNKQAKGTVLEARLDKTKGNIVNLLVIRGTLNIGDTIIVGTSIGRIRGMINYKGDKITKAGPSTPVEVLGLSTMPQAGETFYEVKDEKMAKKLIERREASRREKMLKSTNAVTLEDLYSNISKGNIKKLNIIVKADVSGSAEAIKKSLENLSTDEVAIKVIHSQVGPVTLSDVNLAKVAGAIVIAFNVRPEAMAKEQAMKDGVEIKQYSVIYAAIEDVKMAMIGMLDPEYKEEVIGNAEIRQTYKISKVGTIAGAYVTSGKVTRNAGVRILRDNVVLCDSKLCSLKRFKDDVKEVKEGYECGIQIEGFNDIQVGDILEVYEIVKIERKSLKKEN